MPEELSLRPITQLAPLIQNKQVSPLELFDETLKRITELQPKLNSFITITGAEAEILQGHYRGPLHGIPISIKDLFATRGVRTTAGSKVLDKWIPDFATAVRQLRTSGHGDGRENQHARVCVWRD